MTARKPRRIDRVIARYGDRCPWCDHGGCATIEHMRPQVECKLLGLPYDNLENLRPTHGGGGVTRNACPTCGLNCNQVRGVLSPAAGRAKVQARMAGVGPPVRRGSLVTTQPTPKSPDYRPDRSNV